MKIVYILIAAAILFIAFYLYGQSESDRAPLLRTQQEKSSSQTSPETVTVIAENLETPWAIAFLPDRGMLVTERSGNVRLITASGELQKEPVVTLTAVKQVGEGGLLGIALDPNFAAKAYVYLYYTYSSSGDNTRNRVVRMKFENNRLTDEQILLDNIPGASNHNGGRIKFGPDGLLYIGTGDAGEPSQAQNTQSLAGKILRITPDGNVPSGNPFNNPIYSYGHRNVQGLAWNDRGELWATEHGRSGVTSGFDELNRIEPGKNYGWPEIEGSETRAGMVTPIRNSGQATTWAPSGAAFIGNSLFYSGLRGQTLYEGVLKNDAVAEVKEHFAQEFGRIREAVVGPDDMLYITTSNTDGRGMPGDTDDRVIRINPTKL